MTSAPLASLDALHDASVVAPQTAAPSVAIITLGCGRNEVDSDQVSGSLTAAGFRIEGDPAVADAVIVNTCAFIESAKRESIETILDAAEFKTDGRARALLVTGCMAQRYTDELRRTLPEADRVVPFADYGRLPELITQCLSGNAMPDLDRPIDTSGGPLAPGPGAGHATNDSGSAHGPSPVGSARVARTGARAGVGLPLLFPAPSGRPFAPRPTPTGPIARVKLAEGCDRDCSFCAIPSFRGRFRSRPAEEVLAEARWLASEGVAEVVLVAENSTSYGKDRGGRTELLGLLDHLSGIAGLERIRLQYLQPDELSDDLIAAIATNPVVCSYFDLSLQHASADVLRRMRRGGSSEAFLELIARIRALDPDAALRSNFILGFPGEREADVRTLEDFLEAAQLDWAGFFTYSPEDGTPARHLPGRVPPARAQRRLERVQALQDQILERRQATWIGRELDILLEHVASDASSGAGRSFREAPDTDGTVEVTTDVSSPKGAVVEDAVTLGEHRASPLRVGKIVRCVVDAADGPDLQARVISLHAASVGGGRSRP